MVGTISNDAKSCPHIRFNSFEWNYTHDHTMGVHVGLEGRLDEATIRRNP